MATEDRIQYERIDRQGWPRFLGGSLSANINQAVWPVYHDSASSTGAEVTYVGVFLKRGVKLAAWAGVLPTLDREHEQEVVRDSEVVVALRKHVLPTVSYVGQLGLPAIKFLGPSASTSFGESWIGTAGELADVLSDINALAFQIEQDEHGLVRPSYHALKHCVQLILILARKGELVKPSDISTDGNGAIRVSWASEDREAELVCPSEETQTPYMYYSSSDSYGTETDLRPEALLRRIHWSMGGE